jgi:hypothetical protein
MGSVTDTSQQAWLGWRRSEAMARSLAVVMFGLAMGALTAVLQAHLNHPWSSLVNAASPWVAPAVAVGHMWRRVSFAALAGTAVCLLELLGYSATDTARGYATSHSELVFWGLAALVGGPVFGAAGWAMKWGPTRLRGLGASALPAAFIAEAVVSYAWRLHYWSSAILFVAVGVAALAILGSGRGEGVRALGWLAATLPVALAGELLLGMAYH